MSKGLLAWWHRRIVSRGLAGAALFAVPVAVAALIGFGTSLSGVAGGLTAFTSGPDAVPAAAQARSSKLNRAVVALANKPPRSVARNTGGVSNEPSGSGPGNGVSVGPGTGGSGGGSPTNPSVSVAPSGTTSSAPEVSVPDTGGVTETTTTTTNNAVNQVGDAVNNLLGGVGQTLNNLLNGGQ